MMLWMNIKMAWATFKGAKIRTLLTMLGIIIGVTSVVTIVSLGEGVKKQVSDEIGRLGNDLVQVTPGKSVTRNEQGEITSYDFTAAFGTSTLSEQDVSSIRETENVRAVAPFSIINGTVAVDDAEKTGITVLATATDIATVLNLEIASGKFAENTDNEGYAVTVGDGFAKEYLQGSDPIGRTITIRGKNFTVVGVMSEYSSVASSFGPDLNKAIYIPFQTGKEFNQGVALINEIDIKVSDSNQIDQTVTDITKTLMANHDGEEDFTVLKQEELVNVTDSIFNILTSFVAAIASISLVVGGIGIMNIMLVAVSERTREIGIRKAIGATNVQIRLQFLVEAIVITLFGGFIGVALSYLIGFIVTAQTDLTPVITPQILLVATGVSTLVGVIFGLAPAIQASRKDPIDSLRHE